MWLSPYFSGSPSINSLALNDTVRKVAVVMQAQSANAITHVGFRHTSTTGTSPTYRVSVQGVDGSGQPNGTIVGGGSPASATFSPTSLAYGAATWQWVALTNSYTPSRGEWISLVVDYSSGTVNGSNFSSIGYYLNEPMVCQPSALDFQTATWNKRTSQSILSYKTVSNAVGLPVATNGTQDFTSPAEYGVRFTIPSGWCSTYKIAGFRFIGNPPAASTYSGYLYSGGGASDTTQIQSVTAIDGDFTGSVNKIQDVYFTDSTLQTLTAGSTYRISLLPGGAVNTRLNYFDVSATNDFNAWPLGDNACWTTRSGGSWTDTTTRRPICALILDDITGGSSGSAVWTPRAMTGGFTA